MNKGVEFFLKSIGVTITPEELEAAFERPYRLPDPITHSP
jgi:hypothetical protein